MTVIWNLRPAGLGKWTEGWFFNPDDGETYSVNAELRSADTIIARIYRVRAAQFRGMVLTRTVGFPIDSDTK
jgi:uncharacterized protein (DUF2147 family)